MAGDSVAAGSGHSYTLALRAKVSVLMLGAAGLLAVAAGCGGGAGESDKTFEGDGYAFTYPGAWAEQGGEVNTGRFDVVVAPPEGGPNNVSLTVIDDGVAEPVTEANIGRAVRDLRPAVDALMERAGGVLEVEPAEATYGGLPGFRFEHSSTGVDPAVRVRAIWLFDGTTAYTFGCQFVPSGVEEVGEACELILSSFQVSR